MSLCYTHKLLSKISASSCELWGRWPYFEMLLISYSRSLKQTDVHWISRGLNSCWNTKMGPKARGKRFPLPRCFTLRWRHNGRDVVSNRQPHDCLLNRLFRRRSKKTSKLRGTGLSAGNSPVTGEFPAQRASNQENVPIWWRHHGNAGPNKFVLVGNSLERGYTMVGTPSASLAQWGEPPIHSLPKGPVIRNPGVFFDVSLKKLLNNQSNYRWFETPKWSCDMVNREYWHRLNHHICSRLFYILAKFIFLGRFMLFTYTFSWGVLHWYTPCCHLLKCLRQRRSLFHFRGLNCQESSMLKPCELTKIFQPNIWLVASRGASQSEATLKNLC